MKRKLELSLEQAQKLYKEQPEMRELLLTTFSKDELEEVGLRDWEEAIRNMNYLYFVNAYSEIRDISVPRAIMPNGSNLNLVPSEKHAKSILAFCQLSILMNDLGDECKVDWSDKSTKYCIYRYINTVRISLWCHSYEFLAFKTKTVAKAFLKKHEELIKDYFML